MARKHSTETLKVRLFGASPEDWARFIELPYFTAKWKHLGLDDDDLRALEIGLVLQPKQAPVVPGTGGLRKLRFRRAAGNRGKSGSFRVGYVYFEAFGVIGLLAIYSKAEQADIPPGQRTQIKKAIEYLYHWVSCGG